jgi:hypothetical protein
MTPSLHLRVISNLGSRLEVVCHVAFTKYPDDRATWSGLTPVRSITFLFQHISRRGSRIFCREGSNSRRGSRHLIRGVGPYADRMLAHMCAVGACRYEGSGVLPQNIWKCWCSEMRFQANPDGTILAQNDIELLCEARESLAACWIILRSVIKVNSVHSSISNLGFL